MGIFVLAIIVIIVFGILFTKGGHKNSISKNSISELSEDQKYYLGTKCIGLSPRKGYEKFEIMGCYYRKLPLKMVGKFNGYAVAQLDNKYDPYTIAIYNDNGIHLGFLPRDNLKLHTYIICEGKSVHAYGYIGCNGLGSMYGEVCVETDKTIVTKRNKLYVVE